jgi:hypothetical protein
MELFSCIVGREIWVLMGHGIGRAWEGWVVEDCELR